MVPLFLDQVVLTTLFSGSVAAAARRLAFPDEEMAKLEETNVGTSSTASPAELEALQKEKDEFSLC